MITIFCIRPKGFNVGNDAIFLAMELFLYEAFGQLVNLISLPATSRYESQAKAGLTARTVYEINQYGHGVIVGGGNLYENGELEVDLGALEALEVPLMLFSLSSGRIYNCSHELVMRTDTMPKHIVLALNRKAKYSLARDSATNAYLHSIGCKDSQVGGCPTLYLDRLAKRLPQLSASDRAVTLISVRNPTLMSIPLQKKSRVRRDIQGIIDALRSEGLHDVRLLCHDHRDVSFAASFSDIDYIFTGDVYTYLALLHSCTLNVSYRLHAVLPCLAFSTPTIKISYDERAISLMESIGLGPWNINMIHSNDVVGEVIDRYRRLDDFRTLRTQALPKWNQLYKVNMSVFREFAKDVRAYKNGVAQVGANLY